MKVHLRPFTLVRDLAVASIFIGGIFIPIVGLPLNLERMLGFLGFMLVPAALFGSGLFFRLMCVWFVSAVLATFLSPYPERLLNSLAFYAVPLGVLAWFQPAFRVETLSKEFVGFLLALVGVIAPITFFLAQSGVADLSVVLDVGRLRFLAIEANLFGAATTAVVLLYLPFIRTIFDKILTACGIGAVFLSYSRGPYFALIVGILVYSFSMGYHRKIGAVFSFFIIASTAAVYAMFFFDISNLPSSFGREGTLYVRLVTLDVAWTKVQEAFLFGRGPLEFGVANPGLIYEFGGTNEQGVWIWQMFLSIWHDTGIFGLTIYVCALFVALRNSITAIVKNVDKPVRASYLAAFVALLLVSQTTAMHLTGTFAAVMGLASLPVRLHVRRPQPHGTTQIAEASI